MPVQLSALDEPMHACVQSQLCGFRDKSSRVPALVMFKPVDKFNEPDVRRKVVRLMDHGLTNRLRDLRGDMRVIHATPITSLENVPTGIAEFEDKPVNSTPQAAKVGPTPRGSCPTPRPSCPNR